MNWVLATLDSLPIEIIDGDRSAKYPKREEFLDEGMPFLNSTNIVDNRLDLTETNFVSMEKYNQIRKGRFQAGDILMTTRGSIGKVAWMPPGLQGLINAQMLILRVDPNALDGRFLFSVLSSDGAQQSLKNFASGSAQPQIPIRDLRQISIRIPDLVTQRRIASILSAYDDLIENNTRRIAILEEMARRLYEEWFVRFRFPGHEGVPMVESELGLVPEGWGLKKVNDIVLRLPSGVVYKQADVSPEGTVPVIDQSTSELLGFHNNASAHKASADAPVVIFGDHTCKMQLMVMPFSLGPNTVPFVAKELAVHYIFWVIRGLIKTQEYKRHWSDLMKKSVIVAPGSIAQLFAEQIQSMAEFSELLKRKNRNLRTTRDLLLPKLISGELDVSTLPEPQAQTA